MRSNIRSKLLCDERMLKHCKNNNVPIDIYWDFSKYCKYIMPEYNFRTFHFEIMKWLDLMLESRRGIWVLCVPPQHGKTLLTSLLITYYIGLYPNNTALYYTHSSDQAVDVTKKNIYPILYNENYLKAFPSVRFKYSIDRKESSEKTKMMRKANSLEDNRITIVDKRGGIISRGVGQSINGIPAHLLAADDLYRNYKDAQSSVVRENVTNSLLNDAFARAQDNTVRLLATTRYHNEDFIGIVDNIVSNSLMDKVLYKKMIWKAIAEKDNEYSYDTRKRGQLLIPERDEGYFIQRKSSPAMFSAMYQQNPLPDSDSGIFRKEYVQYIQQFEVTAPYISIDTNIKKHIKDGDFTAITVWEKRGNDHILVELINEKYNFTDLELAILDIINKYSNYISIIIEAQGSGEQVVDRLTNPLNGFNIPRMKLIRNSKSKLENFQLSLPYFASNNVFINDDDKLVDKDILLDQLYRFDGSGRGHDDIVDSISLYLNYIRENYRITSGIRAIPLLNNIQSHKIYYSSKHASR